MVHGGVTHLRSELSLRTGGFSSSHLLQPSPGLYFIHLSSSQLLYAPYRFAPRGEKFFTPSLKDMDHEHFVLRCCHSIACCLVPVVGNQLALDFT